MHSLQLAHLAPVDAVKMLRLARRRFGSLVSAPLARSLARMNVHAPNAMQQKALPIALAGDDDLLVCSQTGSGKTLIFLLPMLEALANCMPPETLVTTPQGGHAVWLTLPPDVDGVTLHEAAQRAGIVYSRGDFYSIDGRFSNCLALSFVNQPDAPIEAGIAELAELIAQQPNDGKRSEAV